MTLHPPPGLVNLSDEGIRSYNYYWRKQEELDMSEQELRAAGVAGDFILARSELLTPLRAANEKLKQSRYELVVKDGYRSPELYALVQRKREKRWGKTATDRLLNMKDMPHRSGLVVDVNLVDLETGLELKLRDPEHDDDGAQFIGFYTDQDDPASREFQRLQELLIKTMLAAGFKLGKKREFWHFEYPVE